MVMLQGQVSLLMAHAAQASRGFCSGTNLTDFEVGPRSKLFPEAPSAPSLRKRSGSVQMVHFQVEVFTAALFFQELEDAAVKRQLMFDGTAAQKNALEQRSGLNRRLLLDCFYLLVLPCVRMCVRVCCCNLHRFSAHITGVPPDDKPMHSSSPTSSG